LKATFNIIFNSRLFSTKFIEDLDYTPNQYQANPKPLKPRLLPSDLYEIENAVRSEKHRPSPKPRANNPEAEEYIRQIRKEAIELQPVRNFELQPLVNAYSVDLAEKLLHEEVERITRELAAEVVGHELSMAGAYEKPLYDKVVDFTQNEMLRQIAEQVLAEERERAKGKDQDAIKKVAQDELVTNLMLDHMLDKMAQHGRASAENEDIGKILDGE
jgi:FKBP-type peptidyl-prolyl cis-trans isomerase (trigger factor)